MLDLLLQSSMPQSDGLDSILDEISKLAGVGEIEYKDGKIFWECKNLLATVFIHGKSQRKHHVDAGEVNRAAVPRIVELIQKYPEFGNGLDLYRRKKS